MTEPETRQLTEARDLWKRTTTVLVPAVDAIARPETLAAVHRQHGGEHIELINPDDAFAYGRLLDTYWRRSRNLIIVEHDIIPPDGALRELATCTAGWCTMRYLIGGQQYAYGLGIARFSAVLLTTHPLAAYHAARSPRGVEYATPWMALDTRLYSELTKRKVTPHVHDGTAVHLHAYPDAAGDDG